MMVRFMRRLGQIVIGHPGMVAGTVLILTLFLYANIHNLRTGTDLTDMFGNRDPQWRQPARLARNSAMAISSLYWWRLPRETGIQTPEMEEMADHLTSEMKSQWAIQG
jgi:predicted RND superfamily exporter protein